MPKAIFSKGRFSIPSAEDPGVYVTFEGWTNGNGLGCGNFEDVYLEKPEAMRFCEISLVSYDEEKDQFVDYSSSEGDFYPAEKLMTTEGEKVLYQIGGGGLVWEKE